jgi:excisionase family DNA binding protein
MMAEKTDEAAARASADTLDVNEAAAMLKIAPRTVTELAHSGELPGCKIGISWVFLREALMHYLRQQTELQTRERRIKSGLEEKIAAGVVHETRRQRKRRTTNEVLREFGILPKAPNEETLDE